MVSLKIHVNHFSDTRNEKQNVETKITEFISEIEKFNSSIKIVSPIVVQYDNELNVLKQSFETDFANLSEKKQKLISSIEQLNNEIMKHKELLHLKEKQYKELTENMTNGMLY